MEKNKIITTRIIVPKLFECEMGASIKGLNKIKKLLKISDDVEEFAYKIGLSFYTLFLMNTKNSDKSKTNFIYDLDDEANYHKLLSATLTFFYQNNLFKDEDKKEIYDLFEEAKGLILITKNDSI